MTPYRKPQVKKPVWTVEDGTLLCKITEESGTEFTLIIYSYGNVVVKQIFTNYIVAKGFAEGFIKGRKECNKSWQENFK